MLAQTPPMGWNSWNTYGHEVNAQVVMETADAFVSEGLAEAGYEYVVIDDLWEADERVDGRLTWDAKKFPDGIPALAWCAICGLARTWDAIAAIFRPWWAATTWR
jgi:alpha-galactosidase